MGRDYKPQHTFVFTDGGKTPAETVVRYSKAKKVTDIVLNLVAIPLGVALAFMPDKHGSIAGYIFRGIFGLVLVVFPGFSIYMRAQQWANQTPRFTLSNQGIRTEAGVLYSWAVISHEQVLKKGSGKYTSYYLSFEVQGSPIKVQIDGFNVSRKELARLLVVYRQWYGQVRK